MVSRVENSRRRDHLVSRLGWTAPSSVALQPVIQKGLQRSYVPICSIRRRMRRRCYELCLVADLEDQGAGVLAVAHGESEAARLVQPSRRLEIELIAIRPNAPDDEALSDDDEDGGDEGQAVAADGDHPQNEEQAECDQCPRCWLDPTWRRPTGVHSKMLASIPIGGRLG